MPKATLTFDLPEEDSIYQMTINAGKYYSALFEIDQFLRSKIKYAEDNVTDEQIDTFQLVRDELWSILNSSNINLDL